MIQRQRDLAAAQSAGIVAMVAYGNARVALHQTLGAPLEANHFSIAEARTGTLAKASSLPADLPTAPRR